MKKTAFKNEAYPEDMEYPIDDIPDVSDICRDTVWVTQRGERIRIRNLKDSHLKNLVDFVSGRVGDGTKVGDPKLFHVLVEECELRGFSSSDIQGQKPFTDASGTKMLYDKERRDFIYLDENDKEIIYPSLPTKWATLRVLSAKNITQKQQQAFEDSVTELCLYNHEWTCFYSEKGIAKKDWRCKDTSIPQLLGEMKKLAKKNPFMDFVAELENDVIEDDDFGSSSYSKTFGKFTVKNGTAIFEIYDSHSGS